ncbi:hypothetical protein [Shewanella sp. YIC-542]|uniref:hypothetical protein n=1 Tax=Shewanella mytili TaxID=3377111 RepID=UPI00398E91BC
MKSVTSFLAATVMLAGSVVSGNAMADDTLPNRSAVLHAVSSTITIQAQELLLKAQADIMASLQQELGNTIAAITEDASLGQESLSPAAATELAAVTISREQ